MLLRSIKEHLLTHVPRRHFYAHEHPEWLARDMKIMFGRGGGAAGVVTNRDGYDTTNRARL